MVLLENKTIGGFMQKWEYEVYAPYTMEDTHANYTTEKLNDFGEKGWECYSVLNDKDKKRLVYFFKRPVL
tara:strand:- start:297 stop:506 length:210 start_codon:yes stop_codon:yes gene_type:complete